MSPPAGLGGAAGTRAMPGPQSSWLEAVHAAGIAAGTCTSCTAQDGINAQHTHSTGGQQCTARTAQRGRSRVRARGKWLVTVWSVAPATGLCCTPASTKLEPVLPGSLRTGSSKTAHLLRHATHLSCITKGNHAYMATVMLPLAAFAGYSSGLVDIAVW